ncbi:hypothetical protein RHSIM_Rhsim08G0019500 [Rhododendron simsii]|uniref:Uncharacterized protein n=1 Tax=Rhododendron simsii TaxID=118357 RepID=A0A834LGQ2_RHOSS|nr:hypothetical protein RHSIM_Rhsim08G0019500 [Rhododendron simsii]
MNFADPSTAFLAAAGGHTVKLFDASVESGDPCTLSYTPSPGLQANSVKWNHTNFVLLWRVLETIRISLCGGRMKHEGDFSSVNHLISVQCAIAKLSMHLASVSLSGDVILHSLASGARAAEFKDPKNQVLRVLDYWRISRHLLVTAGDDGSVHLWDTTGRSPKGERSKMSSQSICFPHRRMSALLHARVQIVWLNLVGDESETVELQAVGGELLLTAMPPYFRIDTRTNILKSEQSKSDRRLILPGKHLDTT